MKISKKDQAFLLLIASVLVVLYAIYSFFSFLFHSATFSSSAVGNIIIAESETSKQQWLNVDRNLEISDLKNRVILLNFWNYNCQKCDNVFAEIDKIQNHYGDKITAITVHFPNSEDEKNYDTLRKAVIKNSIQHPVLNDIDNVVKNNFEVTEIPTVILIDIHGDIVKKFSGSAIFEEMAALVKKTINKYQYEISHDNLPIYLEKNHFADNVLSFPTKLEYSPNFKFQSYDAPAIFINNFAESNIIVTSLLGEIITTIGQGGKGFADGNFDQAYFNSPHGLLYHNNKLYVADTGNNALREVDFESGKVTTLIGSGAVGGKIASSEVDIEKLNLAFPTAITFFPDKNHIAIANSGTNQILKYDIKNKKISAFKDTQEIEKAKLFSDVSDMFFYGKKLYITNSAQASLLEMSNDGEVNILVDKNSLNDLKNPVAITVDDTGIYVVDSATHSVKKYDFSSKKLNNFLGSGQRGDNLASGIKINFDKPSGIVAMLDHFYISDTNNNRIISVDRGSLNAELLDILPPLKSPKRTNLEYLPNLEREPDIEVTAKKDIKVKITLKEGWKINEMGPSFLSLLELVSDNEAELVADFDWNIIQKKLLTLPKLSDNKTYLLQGVIYYCEDKKNALCFVKSYEQKILVDSGSELEQIEVKLGD